MPILWMLHVGFSYIDTMFHEVGHVIFNWLYGYPSLPAFDFVHGGGFAPSWDRSWIVQIGVWGGLGYLLYIFYQERHMVLFFALGGFVAVGVLTSLFETLREAIVLFMGIGSSAVVGSLFMARGYHNVLLTRPAERWLNPFIGMHMVYGQIMIGWKLMYDPYFTQFYTAQKGGHRFGDLHRIQDSFYGLSIDVVCWLVILFSLIATAVSMFALWFYKETRY